MLSSSLMHCSTRVHMHEHVLHLVRLGRPVHKVCAHIASDDCRKTGSLTNEPANQRSNQHGPWQPLDTFISMTDQDLHHARCRHLRRLRREAQHHKAGELEQALAIAVRKGKARIEHRSAGLGWLQLKHKKYKNFSCKTNANKVQNLAYTEIENDSELQIQHTQYEYPVECH